MDKLRRVTKNNRFSRNVQEPDSTRDYNRIIDKINEIINEDAADNASLAGDNIFAGSNTFSENIQFAAGAYGVTAHAGGGQVGATPLTGMFSNIAVCATNGDSCILPEALAGNFMIVATSEVVVGTPQIFPAVGEQIDTMGVNVPLTVTSGTVVMFSCDADGNWVSTSLYDINHIYNALNTIEHDAVTPIDILYADLATLITTSTLESGRQYRIIDYATAYNIFDGGTNTVIKAQLGTVEPLIVIATGKSTLAKEAYSELYPQDIIYYNPLVNAVDRAAFIAAGDVGYIDGGDVVPNFKGVIEFRHDTKQNVSTWYDFRNIKFRRWAVDAVAYAVGTAYVAQDVCKSGVDGKIYKCITATTGEGDPTVNTADWILWLDITTDAYVSWTSDKTYLSTGDINTGNLILGIATYLDYWTYGQFESHYPYIHDVIIDKTDLSQAIDIDSYKSSINNIVFKSLMHVNNTNTIHIGSQSFNNTFGKQCRFFNTKSRFYRNIIGEVVSTINIEDSFYRNCIGNNSYSNIINMNCSNNVFVYFTDNKIGDSFMNNNVKSGFINNITGTNFNYSTVGTSCQNNTFGNDINVKIGNGFHYNIISNYLRGTIGDDFMNSFIGNHNSQVTIGNTCSGISIGEKNGTITLGAGCQNLTFKNGCTFTNTNATALKNTTFENGSVVNGLDFAAATHIKAAYSKTVFMNATPAAQLSYFNAANALTVVNVNA